jgi:hypothetical protein
MSMLYGSRLLFFRFMTEIGYPDNLLSDYSKFICSLSFLQKKINVMFSKVEVGRLSGVIESVAEIKSLLLNLKLEEHRLMESVTALLNRFENLDAFNGTVKLRKLLTNMR